jgi:hypothetical protein
MVSITQAAGGTPGALSLSHSSLNFASNGLLITGPQSVSVSFTGQGAAWTASSSRSNVSVSPGSGLGAGTFTVSATVGSSAVVTVTAPGATNSPQQLQVNVASVGAAVLSGSFDTPASGTAGIAGAIAVNGWALDSVEVAKVDIWREPVAAEGPGGLIYIGDAVFVEGARPDVEGAYPGIPLNYRAGWGYLLLTNFLPGSSGSSPSGNGTYKLHAIAHGKSGSSMDLGVHTIGTDNAHAAKPFGTIDAPGQGATISGNPYYNFAWALTQNPYFIPIDGSTLTVYVDGVPLGHPVYNQPRADIANAFPGLANSGGAVGFFALDTTAYANGVHTISWVVYDNQGRGDGIGSRYFTILNSGRLAVSEAPPLESPRVNKTHSPGRDRLNVEMQELQRLELPLDASHAYALMGGERRQLPIGSSLKDGIFYWQPGAGFLGEYRLVFERLGQHDVIVHVKIRPQRFE